MTPVRRTTKALAARIDSDYIRRTGRLGRIRRVLTAAACVVAVGWLTLHARRGDERIVNPGPVASAHAQWEHNCAACHGGTHASAAGAAQGDSRFFKSVSDEACLTCHSAAAHHPAQTTLIAADDKTSAGCAACHVEHRGDAALVAASDAHCVRCHGDLAPNSKSPPSVQVSITAFLAGGASNGGSHPPLGRSLMKGGQMFDPTAVKFNHDFHFNDSRGPRMTDCASCHGADSPSPAATRPARGATSVPPWATPKDRPSAWTADGERRYMNPVSYQRHCAECHELPGVGNVTVAHEDLSLVRAQLATVLPAEAQKFLPGGAPVKAVPGRRAAAADPDAVVKKLQELLAQKNLPKDQLDPAAARLAALRGATPTALAEFHVAYTNNQSCVKCHQLADHAADAPLTTIPTGIPDAPRRWYVNGRFDHHAHRHVSCVDCHQQALNSRLTSDVLLPDINNCASCHHPARDRQRGASSSCVTCHFYHDRTQSAQALRTFVGTRP